MKKVLALRTAGRPSPFPHVLIGRGGRMGRQPLLLGPTSTGDPNALFDKTGRGLAGPDGRVTPAGRETVERELADYARETVQLIRVVWGPGDGTSFLPDGRTVRGGDHPHAEPQLDEDVPGDAVVLVPCLAIPVPGLAFESTHVCVRAIDRDHVEVSTGHRVVLADLSWAGTPGRPDPFADLFDGEGTLVPPRTYRGVAVEGHDGGALYGPVQPDGLDTRIVRRWADVVAAALDEVAGRPVAQRTLDEVWSYLHADAVMVGVLEAA